AGAQLGRRRVERLDQLVGALVALAALADAAIDDLLQRVAALERPHFGRAYALARIPLDQHPEQLADLIHIVAGLPFRRRAGNQIARGHVRIQGAHGDAAMIVLLTDDAEVAKFQLAAFADEYVQRRQIAMEQLPPMELAEHLEDAGDLAASGGFRPGLLDAAQE